MNELNLDPRCTAVIVIDIQKGIVAMAAGAPHPTPSVVANCVNLLTACRRAGAHPVLVHVGGSLNGADLLHPVADEPMRRAAALPSDWSDLLPELGSSPGDTVILKRQWGAFYGTDLDLQLRRRGLTIIILCGIATEFGVESTARDAYERGYELVFAEDAMTGRTAESHANAITHIFPRIGRCAALKRSSPLYKRRLGDKTAVPRTCRSCPSPLVYTGVHSAIVIANVVSPESSRR